jgi:hypothetical protein
MNDDVPARESSLTRMTAAQRHREFGDQRAMWLVKNGPNRIAILLHRAATTGAEALAAIDLASGDGGRVWSDFLATWTIWNHVRTVSALIAAVLVMLGFCVLRAGSFGIAVAP